MKTLHGYKNTASSKGKPSEYQIDPLDVASIKCWFNGNGNPSYVFHMNSGDTYYLVDDYDAMNGIRHIGREIVGRKRDMFV